MRFAEVLESKMKDETLENKRVELPGPTAKPFPALSKTESVRLFSNTPWSPIATPKARLHQVYSTTDRSAATAPTSTPIKPAPVQIVEPSFQTQDLSGSERQGLQFLVLSGASGLSESFTKSQLQREYRKLVKVMHPDHHHANGPEAAANASTEFLKLQEAKQRLWRLFL